MNQFLVFLVIVQVGGAAASFRDLNFDSANTSNVTTNSSLHYGTGPVADLIPGWQVYLPDQAYPTNSSGEGVIFFNSSIRDIHSASVYAVGVLQDNLGLSSSVVSQLSAPYALSLQPVFPIEGSTSHFDLVQTGDVPIGATTLRFVCVGNKFQLSMGGANVPIIYQQVASGSRGSAFIGTADISAFSGTTTEMRFKTAPGKCGDFYVIDSIEFLPVPEPNIIVLTAIGGVAITLARRVRRFS